MKANQFFQNLLVMLFAAAIVALGAQELRKRYTSKVAGREERQVKELIQELHGGDIRARMSDRQNRSSMTMPSLWGKSSPAKSQTRREPSVTKEETAQHTDKLTSKDRSELDQLINTVDK